MKHSFIFLLLVAMLPIPVYGFSLTPDPQESSIDFEFYKPRGEVSTYYTELAFTIRNDENSTVYLTYYDNEPSNVDVGIISKPSSLGPYGSGTVRLGITLPYYLSEGPHSGSIDVYCSGWSCKNVPFTINIRWPPATLKVTWSSYFGKVRAGDRYTKELTITEIMKYKSARNVKLELSDEGAPGQFTYNENLGDFNPGDSKSVSVALNVPERNLVPGTYRVEAYFGSRDDVDREDDPSCVYVIPRPEMRLSTNTLDLGRITFMPGKDVATKTMTIQEIGGYTPIEGLVIDYSSAAGWISLDESPSYISRGSSRSYPFRVTLPSNFDLTLYSWILNVNTQYAGSAKINAKVDVYFDVEPAIEACKSLSNLAVVGAYSAAKELQQTCVLMLQYAEKNVKNKMELQNTMTVYGGVRSFLDNLENAKKEHENKNFEKTGDFLVNVGMAINKIKSGSSGVNDPSLKQFSNKAVTSASTLWNSPSGSIFDSLNEQATFYENSNYRLSAISYKKISEIYELGGDDSKAKSYSEKYERLVEKYRNATVLAGLLRNEADKSVDKIKEKTTLLGENFIVLNPFSYDVVSREFISAVRKSEESERLYKNAGKIAEAGELNTQLNVLGAREKFTRQAFMAYMGFWTICFIALVARVTIGAVLYITNETERKFGDILLEG